MKASDFVPEAILKKTYKELANAMVHALADGHMYVEDSENSSEFILDRYNTITTWEDFLSFLEEFSTKWPTYKDTYMNIKNEFYKDDQVSDIQHQLQNLQG